jgi:hypothetical protein
VITVGGVSVPRAAIARLADEMYRTGDKLTAGRLGHAIDHDFASLTLTRREGEQILSALGLVQMDELEPLMDRLRSSLRTGNGTETRLNGSHH